MTLSRPSRFFAALLTIFCLLFTQLAVAAYACPGKSPAHAAVAPDAGMGNMPGCKGMKQDQRALCVAHCDTGHQSLDAPGAPQVQPFVAAEFAVVLLAAPEQNFLSVSLDAGRFTRSTAPPLAIRNCCFRI